MFTCFALMLGLGLAELPSLAAEVEAEARELAAATDVTPVLLEGVHNFADDAAALADALQRAGIDRDLPRTFEGIATDARARADDLANAGPAERDGALARLRLVLDDAAMLAPMAAAAAADAAAEHKVASN